MSKVVMLLPHQNKSNGTLKGDIFNTTQKYFSQHFLGFLIRTKSYASPDGYRDYMK